MANSVDTENCRVVLLAGGTSGEREISLASGKGAYQALCEAGFEVTMLDPANKEDLKALIDVPFDVAFLCMHGKWGEDGTLQGMLEMIGLPYIGSGVWSSSTAMNKAKSKVFYEAAGISTPQSLLLKVNEPFDEAEIESLVSIPCVVKPVAEGSALGVSIVNDRHDLAKAIQEAFKSNSDVMIEQYIEGTELTVAVIGNGDAYALPIIEIVPQSEFYDFESKYAPGGSQHICPARLSESDTAEVMSQAVKAHCALECRGVSRSDFILDKNGVAWILETNTIPGMTATSLLPDAARAAGMEFPQLCIKLIEYALEK